PGTECGAIGLVLVGDGSRKIVEVVDPFFTAAGTETGLKSGHVSYILFLNGRRNGDLGFAPVTFLGGNDDNAVGGVRTINGRGAGAFQNRNIDDVICVERADIIIKDSTVH